MAACSSEMSVHIQKSRKYWTEVTALEYSFRLIPHDAGFFFGWLVQNIHLRLIQ